MKPCKRCGATDRSRRGDCNPCASRRVRRWQIANPEQTCENSKRWRDSHIDSARAKDKAWKQANPVKARLQLARRKARKLNQVGYWPMPESEWLKLLLTFPYCYLCAVKVDSHYHLEHKTPLSRGGLHEASNVRLSCGPCNLRKGTKTVEEYLQGTSYNAAA